MGQNHSTRLFITHTDDPNLRGLPNSVTDQVSFEVLKQLCMEEGITQWDLENMHDKFAEIIHVSHHPDGRKKKKGRVSLDAFQDYFDYTGSEIVSLLFMPGMFYGDFEGLRAADGDDVVDFTRFVHGCLDFGCKNPVELVMSFLSNLLPIKRITPESVVSLAALQELFRTLHSGAEVDLQVPMAAVIEFVLNGQPLLTFDSLLQFVFLFPPLLFPVIEFQHQLRRKVFGIKWWDGREHPMDEQDELLATYGVSVDAVHEMAQCKSLGEAWQAAAQRIVSAMLAARVAGAKVGESAAFVAAALEQLKSGKFRPGNPELEDPVQEALAKAVLRDHFGYRVGDLLLRLATRDDPSDFSTISIQLPSAGRVPKHDEIMATGWKEIHDPRWDKPFWYNHYTGEKHWFDPNDKFGLGKRRNAHTPDVIAKARDAALAAGPPKSPEKPSSRGSSKGSSLTSRGWFGRSGSGSPKGKNTTTTGGPQGLEGTEPPG